MDFKGQKSTPYIVDILHQHGIDQVVICPGSRNAPLTLAFTRHGKFNCLSIVDERSAGYFALGLAQKTGKPVAIVCTSGTATLNFAPAIAEAFYQQVPLMVLTADRPESWIHQQDGQAMEQKNLYANIIAKSYHLKGELYCADDLWHTEKVSNEAVHIAVAQSRPVHINVSFAESLYTDSFEKVKARKIVNYQKLSTDFDWSEVLKNKENILILFGQSEGHEKMPRIAKELSEFPNVVVVAENLSNFPLDLCIPNATEVICGVNDQLKPDVIIYLCGPIVSKQLKRYITALAVPVIRVQTHNEEVDTFQNNQAVVHLTLFSALASLIDHLAKNKISSHFSNTWKLASAKALEKRDQFLGEVPFCDLKVFEWISKHLSSTFRVHLGNSTPVRYAQIFNDHYSANCYFLSNRGTSGIDGSVSTAVGYSYTSGAPNVLIVGDLSFQYDSNAFFNKYSNGYLKVIIINNSGGNIFRVIDGPREQKEREAFFETSIQHEFSHLAKHFDLNYFSVRNEEELDTAWKNFIGLTNRPSVLEIFTDAELSANTFKEFYKYIQQS
jgi:2-succinyl-5-enolpyruvyl-6-hydroxy-3-cyclohexene-1-carboxylate synthase